MSNAMQGGNDLGYALHSNTNTDSAGGEAQDLEGDIYKCTGPPGSHNYAIFCDDQDAPQLADPDSAVQKSRNNNPTAKNMDLSAGSGELPIFEDPSIQAGPKKTQKKQSMMFKQGLNSAQRLPPGLPMG